MKLTDEQKAAIAAEAKDAALQGLTPRDACPWPVQSPEGMHWRAVWILEGGKYPRIGG